MSIGLMYLARLTAQQASWFIFDTGMESLPKSSSIFYSFLCVCIGMESGFLSLGQMVEY
jgi:hypothetical protein